MVMISIINELTQRIVVTKVDKSIKLVVIDLIQQNIYVSNLTTNLLFLLFSV